MCALSWRSVYDMKLQLFKTINEPINNPGDIVKENIDDIEKI